MLKLARRTTRRLLDGYPKRVCRKEYEAQRFRRFNERPVEYSFLFRKLGELYPRSILDVGTGATALPHLMRNCGCLVTAIDNVRDYWPAGMINRHYHVIDDDITRTRLSDSFDLVTCISVLEHIQAPDDALRNMFGLLKGNGHIILTFPYTAGSYVRNVYELPGSAYGQGAPYVTQSYSRHDLQRWLEENDAVVIEQEYWQFWDGEHWTVGEQMVPPKRATADSKHQLTCMLLGRR